MELLLWRDVWIHTIDVWIHTIDGTTVMKRVTYTYRQNGCLWFGDFIYNIFKKFSEYVGVCMCVYSSWRIKHLRIVPGKVLGKFYLSKCDSICMKKYRKCKLSDK
jgi:hypothetical protein